MVHVVSIWLAVAAFGGAGVVNAIAAPAQRSSFARWGYPAWWCRATGGLEIMTAALIVFPATRHAGLLLGVTTIAAAIATVLRHREPSHLAPLGLFVVLLVMAAA